MFLRRIVSRPLTSSSTGKLTNLFVVKSPFNFLKMTVDRKLHVLPNDTPVMTLAAQDAFGLLTEKERLYAHYIGRAAFEGALICLHQLSPEAPSLFTLLIKLFRGQSVANLKEVAVSQCEFTEDEFKAFLVFTAGFFTNYGNYKSFGDTKFIPDLAQEKLLKLIKASEFYKSDPAEKKADNLGGLLKQTFSLGDKDLALDLGDKGVTGYHSWNVTKEDTERIDRFMKANNMEGWNTRLFKQTDGDGKISYEIRLASVEHGETKPSQEFEATSVVVKRGDYSEHLKKVNRNLEKALKYAANDFQRSMLNNYIEHFTTGDLTKHKDGSRAWIKDKGPAVESYIGFIENYRDPVGVRSEFEGFVAAVNRSMSEKFTRLVENADELLPRLPWGADYEKDAFLKPDFTSLDVIAFGSSGIPCGINIPNYDEIRQDEGFKNVSLGNVISAVPKRRTNFLSDEDEVLFKKHHKDAFEVQVGLHELLGHGSGKLFQRRADGTFNFDTEKVKHLITGDKIESWYEVGETWSTKFTSLASAYEECRAEAVGYFLCCFDDVMKIFGFEGEQATNVKYVNWLSELRSGLVGMEFYSPEAKKWGQAHCLARYVLLKVCCEAGGGFVTITETQRPDDGKPDLLFSMDGEKIDSVGRPAIFEFLKLLQLYKSTADVAGATSMWQRYADVDEKWTKYRKIVVDRRQPRSLFVQPNTTVNDNGGVELKMYEDSHEGVIQSVLDRYADADTCDNIATVHERDRHHFVRD